MRLDTTKKWKEQSPLQQRLIIEEVRRGMWMYVEPSLMFNCPHFYQAKKEFPFLYKYDAAWPAVLFFKRVLPSDKTIAHGGPENMQRSTVTVSPIHCHSQG